MPPCVAGTAGCGHALIADVMERRSPSFQSFICAAMMDAFVSLECYAATLLPFCYPEVGCAPRVAGTAGCGHAPIAEVMERRSPSFQFLIVCAAMLDDKILLVETWVLVTGSFFDFFTVPMDKVMEHDGVRDVFGFSTVPMDYVLVIAGVRQTLDFYTVLMDRVMVLDGVHKALDFFTVPMDKVMVLDGVCKSPHFLSVPMDIDAVTVLVGVAFDFLSAAAAALKRIMLHLSSIGSVSATFEKSKRALFLLSWDERKEREGKEQEKKDEEVEEGVINPALVVLQRKAEHGLISSDVRLEGNRVGEVTSVLVQGLDGKHLCVKIEAGILVSALCEKLALKTGIPESVFYLTYKGKVLLAHEALSVERDERLCMRGRLRGGMEGDWTCQHCGRQGCWVTKVRCYRCGKSRYDPPAQQIDGSPNVPGWIRTQARQQTEREWAQATRGAGVGPGTSGQPLGSKTSTPPPQQNQRSQNQRQKTPAQSRAPSPGQEYQEHDALLAALHGLIPGSLWEQVRSSLPKPEVPLTERIMQVQNILDEEKKAANSWKEAVKMREAALLEGRKTLADHMTKVEGLQAELSELETQFFTQRKEKEEQERKDVSEKLAATQVDFEQVPIPEDVDMEDGRNGKKRRGVQVEPMTYEELEANILRTMDNNGKTPEDYAEMIQRVLTKKAQQRAECGESSKVSRLDIQEEENREEDMNL